ncbi:MAG: HypC/HybG/HupF family hydrogenase formation chaperone [Azonexus sp.]
MCLAFPARVIELSGESDAVIDLDGVHKTISLALVDDVAVGDYVIVHVGFALQKLDEAEALATLALVSEIGALEAAPEPQTGADA